jgi:hypothetical protein
MACHAILEATLSRVLAAGLASGALSCLASPAWAQQVTGVIIRQDFSLNYQSDVSGLAAQIETGRERTVAVKPGDTLSKIISREFGVGISNAPDAYEMLKRQIVETNALPGPNDLKAHEPIQIPDALRKALENPNPNKWLNRIPKVVIDSRISSNANLSLDELVQQLGSQWAEYPLLRSVKCRWNRLHLAQGRTGRVSP